MKPVLQKIWSLFTPAERYRVVAMLLLCVLMALAETFGVLSIMPFLSVLARQETILENPVLNTVYTRFGFASAREFTQALGVASIMVVIFSSAFKTVTLHVVNRFMHLMRVSIASRLLARYLQQPYEFFLTRNASLLGKRMLSETDDLVGSLLISLSQLVAQGAIMLAVAALIFWYDAKMACCILFVVALLYGVIFRLVKKRLERIGREWQEANSVRHQACNEALGGVKDVKISHAAAAYQEKFRQASHLFARHWATSDTLAQSPLYMVEAVGYTGLIVIALWLLLNAHDVARILPALGLYGFAAYRMLPSAQIIYRGVARLRFGMNSLDAIVADLTLPDAPQSDRPITALVPQREIRLQGICYAYPSAPEKTVLEDFDLLIAANESVGIIGKSGTGKSTLMDILLGLLQPQAGSLSVDGVPVTGARVLDWQRAIGYVPQHIFLSDASVMENIAFGVPPEAVDLAAVKRAAQVAQIHAFIVDELPQGYATRIGDRGIRLSGGQRQRIGIARALYRDPPVLFMDEATSALDTETEESLNEAIRQLSGNKTIVVIAHRETSLRYCGKIVSLK